MILPYAYTERKTPVDIRTHVWGNIVDMSAETKCRTRTGIVRTVLLRPEQDAALERLIADVGLNRNQLVRLIAEKARPEDIQALINR
jgi:hypothetical protein